MSFYTNPADQPDWGKAPGAFGNLVATVAVAGLGTSTSPKTYVGESPSLVFSVRNGFTTFAGFITITWSEITGFSQFARQQTIPINGPCNTEILVPTLGPVLQVSVTATAVSGLGPLQVDMYQAGIAVANVTHAITGQIANINQSLATGVSTFVQATQLSAGRCQLAISTASAGWQLLVYGTSPTTDLVAALKGTAATGLQTLRFSTPPNQLTLFAVNTDTVAQNVEVSLANV